MEIGEKNNKSKFNLIFRKLFSKKVILPFLLIVIVVGGYKGSKFVKSKDYSGLWDFISTVSSNYIDGMDANPESISIEIKDKDIKILEKNRQHALERGLIINDLDGEYVPGTLEYQGKKIKIKLRLKGHMTDHIETENKWSFRIKVKDKDAFMGMKRFSIQQPGTRGYIYEWIYHELMKREDIIALRYKFINVSVNGKDWGIYALEENFDNELIENNNRKKGPIIRLNPDLYWVKRYNGQKREAVTAEFASYYSANFEAYREDKVLDDSIQKGYYMKAMALAEGFRNRKLSVSQVFDVNRLAKFHAIIDLVGGEHSIDWSDIKYYYNPVTSKLEPVAYESFSDFSVNKITGNYRYVTLDSNESFEDWHTAIFSDSLYFATYVQNLERISQSKYLDDFFSTSNKELNENLKILYKEYPYKKFETKSYYRNQKMITKILNGPQALHVYFDAVKSNQVLLDIGNIESLPIQVKSISFGKQMAFPVHPIVIASKQAGDYIHYGQYLFDLPTNFKWNDSLVSTMLVNYSVLGASGSKTEKVYPFPHTNNEFITEELKNKQSTVSNFSFLIVDEGNNKIYIKPGIQVIASDLIIPAGYQLIANDGVTLDLKNNAQIISYSSLIFTGSEEYPICIESTDSTSQGIELISAPKSFFKNVVFKNIPKITDRAWGRTGGLTFYESAVDFKYCNFHNSKAEDAINLIRSNFVFKNCLFQKMHDDALDVDFSSGVVENCSFEDCKENALDIMMSKVEIKQLNVDKAGNKALNIKAGTQFTGEDINIKNANIAVSAEDLSTVELKNITVSNSEVGFTAYKNKPGAGHASIKVSNVTFVKVKKNYLKEKKSSILVNGLEINEDVKDVEAIIKHDKKGHK